jgi:signal transduction histidine kinase
MRLPKLPAMAPTTAPSAIDWRTVFMLLPQRRFTAAELQRALPTAMSATLKAAVALNVLLMGAAFAVLFWKRGADLLGLYSAGLIAIVLACGGAAWRDPSGTVARTAYWAIPLAGGVLVGLLVGRSQADRTTLAVMVQFLSLSVLGLWFTIVHRHQYIEMRLAELDERERAVEMAQRLASAQLAPHFLFNTLASVQHWVATKDERAGPLLQSLTGYLRATLPMFARALHPVAVEVDLVRRYLEVMQARLGARLRCTVELPPAMGGIEIPPGVLLTLAENAVEHAIEPRVDGGTLSLSARLEGPRALFVVADDGPGLPADAAEGTGLANIRERLRLTHGDRAALSFDTPPGGGCRATVTLPAP